MKLKPNELDKILLILTIEELDRISLQIKEEVNEGWRKIRESRDTKR